MRGNASLRRALTIDRRAKILEARWQELCLEHLPRAPENSMWRYHTTKSFRQISSGWKLHVSATILNAPIMLDRIAPFLKAQGASFKAPRSLMEVGKLNSGLDYQYSQIGKIVTIYPKSDAEAVFLARRLHRLTKNLSGPSVPFDLRFADTSNVYYRYGAFEHVELARGDRKVSAIYAPDGSLVPDIREQPKPDWIADPFAPHKSSSTAKGKPPASLRVLKALVQRGKGGVYVAIDFGVATPRLCLLKEGRRDGETLWDGHDGAWIVRNEKRVLSRLSAAGVSVPRVLSSYELHGNYYVVMEFVDGQTLHQKLLSLSRRLPVTRVIDYGIQLARFIEQLHRTGWCWRDCKPKNIIVTPQGRLVPIDFEGAVPLHRPAPWRWGTPGFISPKSAAHTVTDGVADDIYALGAVLFLLITGRVYEPEKPLAIHQLRRNVPKSLCRLIEGLLATETDRPSQITAVIERLSIILRNLKVRRTPL